MFHIKVVQKIKTKILFSVTFYENRTVDEIKSKKNGEAREDAHNTVPARGIVDK
jgi:hypothetical protein